MFTYIHMHAYGCYFYRSVYIHIYVNIYIYICIWCKLHYIILAVCVSTNKDTRHHKASQGQGPRKGHPSAAPLPPRRRGLQIAISSVLIECKVYTKHEHINMYIYIYMNACIYIYICTYIYICVCLTKHRFKYEHSDHYCSRLGLMG